MQEEIGAGQSYSAASSPVLVSVSIVSHGQAGLVHNLLGDLARCNATPLEVILTLNLEEHLPFPESGQPFPLTLIRNARPRGYGANHNAAFRRAKGDFFCVLNPDIRITENPFPRLTNDLLKPEVGVAAPRIVNPAGNTEDSARRFPTPTFLFKKLLGLVHEIDYEISDATLSPDWVAGMFMVFRREVFAEITGFDERYFLYYEDVDLCRRLRNRGYEVRLIPSVSAVHDARRESRRNLRHLRWHLSSALRYFLTALR
jgi:hypothetical protein